MSTEILKNQKVWFDGYDLTRVSQTIALNNDAETVDATTLGDDTRVNKGGLKTVAASIEGLFDADPIDGALFQAMGAQGKVFSIGNDDAVGAIVYTFKSTLGEYSPSGSTGEMLAFSLNVAAAGELLRGQIVENLTNQSASADGTGIQLGAVGSDQKLYAAVHVLGIDGTSPTFDLEIESDDNASFTSPTTQITFDQITELGSAWQDITGAISDDYWRATWTIGGTAPSVDFVLILSIQ